MAPKFSNLKTEETREDNVAAAAAPIPSTREKLAQAEPQQRILQDQIANLWENNFHKLMETQRDAMPDEPWMFELKNIPRTDLSRALAIWVTNTRKNNGERYKLTSLRAGMAAIVRAWMHLHPGEDVVDIKSSKAMRGEFSLVFNALCRSAEQSHQAVRGGEQADIFTADDIAKVYEEEDSEPAQKRRRRR
jgi:hypothetical protein